MVKLKEARMILKALADDTRLRIVNLLGQGEDINVSELCEALRKNQPVISKHLTRLRLTGIISDRRDGNNVYYGLAGAAPQAERDLVVSITGNLLGMEVFKNDIKQLREIRAKRAA